MEDDKIELIRPSVEVALKAVTPQLIGAVVASFPDNIAPDDVFDDDILGAWAEANGYVKEAA